MHDTVIKTRRRIADEGPRDGLAPLASARFQEAGLSRALSEPLGSQLESAYRGAVRWLRLVSRLQSPAEGETPSGLVDEVIFTSRQLHVVLSELVGFLERAEDNLSDREEITHQESSYEREIAPYSRMESTEAFRTILAEKGGFTPRLAGEGGQVEADLLKIIHLEAKIRGGNAKTSDCYAMVVELLLDARRHLLPAFAEGSHFLKGLTELGTKLA